MGRSGEPGNHKPAGGRRSELTTMTTMTTNSRLTAEGIERLQAAAARVRAGWCQGRLGAYKKSKGPVCAEGAFAACGAPWPVPPAGWRGWTPFNDAPGRTMEEVAQAIEAAIEAHR